MAGLLIARSSEVTLHKPMELGQMKKLDELGMGDADPLRELAWRLTARQRFLHLTVAQSTMTACDLSPERIIKGSLA